MTMERRSFLKLMGAGAGIGAASLMTGCAGLGMEGPTGGRRVVVDSTPKRADCDRGSAAGEHQPGSRQRLLCRRPDR